MGRKQLGVGIGPIHEETYNLYKPSVIIIIITITDTVTTVGINAEQAALQLAARAALVIVPYAKDS